MADDFPVAAMPPSASIEVSPSLLQQVILGDLADRAMTTVPLAMPWIEGGILGGLGHEDALTRYLHDPQILWALGLTGGLGSSAAGWQRMSADALAGLLGTYERLRPQR